MENKKDPMSKLILSMILNSPCLLNSFSNICDQIYLKNIFKTKENRLSYSSNYSFGDNGSNSEEWNSI